ncbi:hypothetical protein CYMTET_49391, partial [Cymbomonas tetramitiformis]
EEAPESGVAAAAMGALRASQEAQAGRDKEHLVEVMEQLKKEANSVASTMEAVVAETRANFQLERDRIIHRSRARIDQDRKDQVIAEGEMKQLKKDSDPRNGELMTSIRASMRSVAGS